MSRETKVLGALALYAAAFLLYAVKWAFTHPTRIRQLSGFLETEEPA